MHETLYTVIDSPLGELRLVGDGHALHRLEFTVAQTHGSLRRPPIDSSWRHDPTPFAAVAGQLLEYFTGGRRRFDLAIASHGNRFERRVWRALAEVPYGETVSYGEIARRIGAPGCTRAVGLASARNRIPIIIPCHRVIGSDGALTGYRDGLARKRWLVDLEAGVLSFVQAMSLA